MQRIHLSKSLATRTPDSVLVKQSYGIKEIVPKTKDALPTASKHWLSHLDTEVTDDEAVHKHTPVNYHRLSSPT